MPATKAGAVSKGRPNDNLGKRKRGHSTSEPRPSSLPPTAPNPSSSTSIEPSPSPSHSPSQSCSPAPAAAATTTTTTEKPARRKRAPKPKPDTTTSTPTSSIDRSTWPPYLVRLEQTHRALSLVATFLSARKHVAPRLDHLRAAVEAHTKRPLLEEDVAAIAALRPPGVRFERVDEASLALSAEGGGNGGKEREFVLAENRGDGGGGREVLVFEFLDGDLKAESGGGGGGGGVQHATGQDRVRMPVFSQRQMMGLIGKRNDKFAQAVDEFVQRCRREGLDPEEAVMRERQRYIPAPPRAGTDEERRLGETLPESIPRERKSIAEIVRELKDSPWYTGQIVPDGHRVFEAQEAVYGDLNFLLSQDLVNALFNARGITKFYAHQAEAINALNEGHNVVVATSTSSGKSLIYQLPVLHALERDPNTRAMYIFPTKALAQDQRRSLKEMMAFMPGMGEMLVETFDGDTPMNERSTIRDEARIIFTNPDMLHLTILPQEDKWRSFLKHLKYVVGMSILWPPFLLGSPRRLMMGLVDELHYYNGLLGSHVAFIMRRLRRTCAAVGNRHVKFVSCSATVANPEQHFKTIFGIDDVRLVDFDGSPSGE